LLDQSNGLNNWFILPVDVGGTLLSGESVTKTELSSLHILILDFLHNLDEVSLDSSLELSDGLVEGSGDASFLEDLLTHFWIDDSEQELLLLGTLGGWEVGGQKVFERVCHFVASDGSDVLEGFLGSGEWLIGSQFDHLAESLEVSDGLLDLGELSASFIEFLLLEEAVSGSTFV